MRRSSTSPAEAPAGASCATSASVRSSCHPRWRASTAARSTSASSSSRATCRSCGGWRQKFREFGVRPEVECFDTGHVGLALQLRDEGLLDDPLVVQFVLGVPGSGVPASVEMVEHLRRMIPPDWPWSVCAIGRAQLALNTYCIIAGGHVRTGLEDNLWFRRGERATNAMLVQRIVRLAGELDRPVATPDEARAILRTG